MSNNGYLIPEVVTGYDLLCVTLKVPDNALYRAALLGQLHALGKWFTWDKSFAPGDTRATQAAAYWRELLDAHLVIDDCGQATPEEGNCREYPAKASFIEWLPQNPFTQPNYTPAGYIFPPWQRVVYTPPGLEIDDVVAYPTSFPWSSVYDLLAGIVWGSIFNGYEQLLAGIGNAIASGAPRFRITLSGVGTVELHLINVLTPLISGGGIALVWQDGDLATFTALDLNKDETAIPPETSNIIIHEVTFTTEGNHVIDVVLLPQVDFQLGPDILLFGGGLRKVVLCGETLTPVVTTTDPCCVDNALLAQIVQKLQELS